MCVLNVMEGRLSSFMSTTTTKLANMIRSRLHYNEEVRTYALLCFFQGKCSGEVILNLKKGWNTRDVVTL